MRGDTSVRRDRSRDGAEQRTNRRDRSQPEHRFQALMNEIGASQLVIEGPFVRMLDDCLGDVRELVSCEQDVARPFKILGNGSGWKRVIVPDTEPDARTHVIKGADPMTIC